MEWFQTILWLLVGLGMLIKGGDMFVDAASWMAEKTGIPKVIVGATVVSLATTLPELLVSFLAAREGKVDIAIGNAVGSAIVNAGLILGIAVAFLPSVVRRGEYFMRTLLMLGATVVLILFGRSGSIGIFASVLLLLIFVLAMADNVWQAVRSAGRKDARVKTSNFRRERTGRRALVVHLVKFVAGAVLIVVGSRLLVDNGSLIATLLGVPERIVAVTVIAIGTSLPELVTAITSIIKKQGGLSAGNLIGANIINLTLVLPLCAFVSGSSLPVSEQFARIDLPVCLLIGCVALLPMLVMGRFRRSQGVLLVAMYGVYLVLTTAVL